MIKNIIADIWLLKEIQFLACSVVLVTIFDNLVAVEARDDLGARKTTGGFRSSATETGAGGTGGGEEGGEVGGGTGGGGGGGGVGGGGGGGGGRGCVKGRGGGGGGVEVSEGWRWTKGWQLIKKCLMKLVKLSWACT